MDINIGKILIQPKDNWNATTSYAYLNLVRYNKKLYICKSVTGAPAGTLPTNTSYYMETTQDGIDAQEIQLQKTATEIQWKRTGETTWTTLITLAAIKGDKGLKGDTGAPGEPAHIHIKWHAEGSTILLDTPEAYVGIYSDNTEEDSALYDDYQWYKSKGEKGDPGNMTGPASSVNENIPIFDGIAGDKVKDSGAKLSDKADVTYVADALALKADVTYTEYLMLAEAILQENLLINNIYDRLEGGIYAAI